MLGLQIEEWFSYCLTTHYSSVKCPSDHRLAQLIASKSKPVVELGIDNFERFDGVGGVGMVGGRHGGR